MDGKLAYQKGNPPLGKPQPWLALGKPQPWLALGQPHPWLAVGKPQPWLATPPFQPLSSPFDHFFLFLKLLLFTSRVLSITVRSPLSTSCTILRKASGTSCP